MQLGSVGLAVDAPTIGRSLGPWPTARGQPLTGGPRIPLGPVRPCITHPCVNFVFLVSDWAVFVRLGALLSDPTRRR